jgi:hypothetical protein
MVRAIIGTIAVLAGFAVVETATDAGTGLAGSCNATEVYALLRPGAEVPVRASPTPEGAVLGTLAVRGAPGETVQSIVTLTGSQKGWARIALDSRDYTAVDGKRHGYGWMPADLLTVDTPLDGTVIVYSRPGLLGEAIGRIENGHQTFRVLGCRGALLRVINARQGNVWIDRWCVRGTGCRR